MQSKFVMNDDGSGGDPLSVANVRERARSQKTMNVNKTK